MVIGNIPLDFRDSLLEQKGVEGLFVMEIIEKQAFGYACACGNLLRGSALVFILGENLKAGVHDLALLFLWQFQKLRIDAYHLLPYRLNRIGLTVLVNTRSLYAVDYFFQGSRMILFFHICWCISL